MVEVGKYYFSTADEIYGMIRKGLIYVTKVNKKTFNYLIADWRDENGKAKVYIHYDWKRRGKLSDSKYFHLANVIPLDNSNSKNGKT